MNKKHTKKAWELVHLPDESESRIKVPKIYYIWRATVTTEIEVSRARYFRLRRLHERCYETSKFVFPESL